MFLDQRVYGSLFARRLEPYRARVAALVFEFGTFARSIFASGADFLARLDPFLAGLPPGFRHAVEIRNPEYLGPDYFGLLAAHNVAHVFNAWTRMPELGEQLELPGAFTADFAVARALLTRGRAYEQAVSRFEPYERLQEPSPPARRALADLAREGLTHRRPTFLLVNNRLEGHAPSTIEAVAGMLLDPEEGVEPDA
jgi:hypothetical protein